MEKCYHCDFPTVVLLDLIEPEILVFRCPQCGEETWSEALTEDAESIFEQVWGMEADREAALRRLRKGYVHDN